MSFWQILSRLAVFSDGETIQRVSDNTSVSSDGTTYTRMGSTTVGSDGSMFTQMGSVSTDGSTRMGSTAIEFNYSYIHYRHLNYVMYCI
jgi:hypothetical protein